MSTSVLALLRSEDSSFSAVVQLLGRFASRVELIHSLDEAIPSVGRETNPVIGVLLPLHVRSGESGIKACLQAKSHPVLSRIPVVGIAPSRDRAVLEAFYGAGADSVALMPFDVEHIFLQVEALARLHRSIQETLQEERDKVALSRGAVECLEVAHDALVIFDASTRLQYANRAARELLQSKRGLSEEQLGKFSDELRPSLNATLSGTKIPSPTPSADFAHEYVAIIGERGLPIGCAVRLTGAADLGHLRNNLEIAFRSQSLALLGTSALLTHLEQSLGGYPLTPLQQFLNSIALEPLRVRLAPLITALTEVLDSVLPASLQLTVHAIPDAPVALRPSDATRLLGHIVLYAAMRAGSDGRIVLESDPVPQGATTTTFLVSAEHGNSQSALVRDFIALAFEDSEVPESSSQGTAQNDRLLGHLRFGLDAAQAIADRYNLRLELKSTATHTKVRLKIPIALAAPTNP